MAASYENGNGNGSGQAHSLKTDSGLLADRLPPQNLEAEQGVLGSILLDNDALHDVVPLLKVEDFYRDTHQVLYRTIRDLDIIRANPVLELPDEETGAGDHVALPGPTRAGGL